MSNPNLFTVYSPAGESFETSRANARDLTTHAGWTFEPTTSIAACTVPPAAEKPKAEEPKIDAPSSPPSEGSSEADEETTEGEGSTEDEATGTEETTEVTEADFDHLETREDVVAELAKQFPEFKPHHLSKRDKLVEKLVELTNG